jgi:hypothetical protein
MLKRVIAFFHRHPKIKTTAVGLGAAAVGAAVNGEFGPKAQSYAAAATGIAAAAGLHLKRPADATAEDKTTK